MKRLVGVLSISLFAAACGVGDPDAGGDGMNMNPLGRQCTAVFTTAGSFTPDAAHPRPADGGTGCWPIGVWTFTATQMSNDCTPAPVLQQKYQFKGEVTLNEDGDPLQSFTYMTEPGSKHIVKVSQGGSGLCEGELNIFSDDGKTQWLFKPALNADNSIAGDGEYGVFDTNQWPF